MSASMLPLQVVEFNGDLDVSSAFLEVLLLGHLYVYACARM